MKDEFDPAAPSSRDDDDRLDDLLFSYVDRLNAGEILDKGQIRDEQPALAERLLDRLQVFEGIGVAFEPASSLGTLGDYTLHRQIGRGGMGVVYEAWENSGPAQVALKVLPAGVAADARSSTRFLREAQIVAKLSHPQIVPVFASGIHGHTPYYAMEYIAGETLAQVLGKLKNVEPGSETAFGKKDSVVYFGKLADAFADVADGLQHAHSKGVVHRDIKPSNLILDAEADRGGRAKGRLRILDFGLARLEGQESLTISGDVVGTPLYMSPEQANRRKIPIDHRTDVYSLGTTMYESLTDQPPFRGKDHEDTLSQIIARDPVEPRKINQRLPKDLETVVLKCLRKNTADRYGTAEALGQDLRRFVRADPIEARPEAGWERLAARVRRHRTKLVVAAAFLTLLLAVAWFDYQRTEVAHQRDLAYEQQKLEAHIGRGVACLENKDYLRAQKDFVAACTLAPEFVEGELLLGKAYYLCRLAKTGIRPLLHPRHFQHPAGSLASRLQSKQRR